MGETHTRMRLRYSACMELNLMCLLNWTLLATQYTPKKTIREANGKPALRGKKLRDDSACS